MKTIIVLCLFSLAAVLAKPSDSYTDKFDNINLDEILGNRRLLVPYVHCTLDKGKCAPEAKELKEHIIEALETKCEKCTEKQKEGTRRVISHLINKEAELWSELTAKYDPDNKYSAKYEKELKEIKQE